MSLLVIFETLGVFVKTLTVHDKYFLCNGENLRQRTEIQLSKKLKTFSPFFTTFAKFTLNFQYFGNKDDSHQLFISEITDCERLC